MKCFLKKHSHQAHADQRKEQYGFIKGAFANLLFTPILKPDQVFHPHYNFALKVGTKTYHANINIQSTNPKFPTLKIWSTTAFATDIHNQKPFLAACQLPAGVYPINHNTHQALAIDYLRGHYFPLQKLQLFENCANPDAAYNDLYNLINNVFANATKTNNTMIGLWGKIYENFLPNQPEPVVGIHDIHMNQGVPHATNNAIWQDGCMTIMQNNTVVFLMFFAFANQCLQTDQNGNCVAQNPS